MNVGMIPENARGSKSIAQKIVKNSLEIQRRFTLFFYYTYASPDEDEGRKAYACYHRKIRDVSYIAAFCGETGETLCIS
jgi:hypothetical protein